MAFNSATVGIRQPTPAHDKILFPGLGMVPVVVMAGANIPINVS
jgi:hypothetical protein